MNLQESYDLYKQRIKANRNYIDFRLKINRIIKERNLIPLMNDAKWLQLQHSITQLNFPPAYFAVLLIDQSLTHESIKNNEATFEKSTPWYFGDWSPFYQQGMPYFINIEYMKVKPLLLRHQGQLVAGLILDECNAFRALLLDLNIAFEEDQQCFKIMGYDLIR